MGYSVPHGLTHGQLQEQPTADDSRFTISSSRRILKASARDSLLVLADDAGQVTLVRFDSSSKGKGRAPSFSQLAEGGAVHAIEVCAIEDKQWAVIARSSRGADVLEVYDAENGQLYATLPPLHRTAPHSLVASALSSTLASVSSSEVLLFDFSADWSCTWALRGPSPTSSTLPSPLATVLWISSTPSTSPEPTAPNDDLLTVWENGDICLWTLSAPSRASHKPMKLVWRISPPSSASSNPPRPTATCSAGGLLFTASSMDGKTDLLVWDVEERSLVHQVSLELDVVASLHVLQGDDEDSVLAIRSGRELYSLRLEATSRGPSLRLLRSEVDAVIRVSEDRAQLLVDGEICAYKIATLLVTASSKTEQSTSSGSGPGFASLGPGSRPADFNSSWLEDVPATRLGRIEALKSYLNCTGSFPSAYRPQIYSTLLRCPSSSKYFSLLASPEDPATMDAFRAEWELADWRAQARMESIIHLLRCHGFSTSALVNSIPPCIYGLVVALPASANPPTEQALFEICLTVLLRWARVLWDETERDGKSELWSLAEEVLEREGTSAPSLRKKGVAISRILGNVAHGLINGVLEMADWIIVLDHIVARRPLFFVCLLGALIDHQQEELASLGASETLDFFRHSHPVSTAELIREAVRRETVLEGTVVEEKVSQLPGFQSELHLDANYRLVCS